MIGESCRALARVPRRVAERADAFRCHGAAWRPEGEWIASLDLVEQGDKLVVKEMGEVGKCGVECKTIEAAAERIMGEHDTDIAEMLFTVRRGAVLFRHQAGVRGPRTPTFTAAACALPPTLAGQEDAGAVLQLALLRGDGRVQPQAGVAAAQPPAGAAV